MTIAIVVIAALLLLAFWFLFLVVARDNRVLSREPSEFELAARRMSESMQEMQRQFAVALTPAFKRAADAMTDFHKAMTRDEHNTGTGPDDA